MSVCNGVKIALFAFGTPTYNERWKDSITVRNCYAAMHGYTSIIEVIPEQTPIGNIHWTKLNLILSYLKFYDWIFYFDLDIFILNHSIPLTHFISHGSHVIVSDEFEAPTLAGMLAFKQSEIGYSFLNLWMSFECQTPDYDNGGLLLSTLYYVGKSNVAHNYSNQIEDCAEIFYRLVLIYILKSVIMIF